MDLLYIACLLAELFFLCVDNFFFGDIHAPRMFNYTSNSKSTVKKKFEEYFRNGLESRAQLCVYVGEEKVVGKCILIENNSDPIFLFHSLDLYGSIYDNDDFGPSNLIPIFSAGKVRKYFQHISVDKGNLDVDLYPDWSPGGQSDS